MWRSVEGVMLVKLFVQEISADSTCCAVITRVLRYALGANCINQLLYKSTDWAISCFHIRSAYGWLMLAGFGERTF